MRPALAKTLKRLWELPPIVLPLATALALFSVVGRALAVSIHTTLGRDQGIFQYVAWALSRGDRDYVDVRDVNGPYIHLVHRLFLALGGEDEMRFHILDRGVTIACFFVLGTALAGLSPRADLERSALSLWARRIVYGLALATVGTAQYLRYLYWDLAQREVFCGWLVCLSTAALLFATDPSRAAKYRANAALLVASGALGVVAVFGKHTFAPYFALHGLTLLLVGMPSLSRGGAPASTGLVHGGRARALAWFTMGASVGFFLGVGSLFALGDPRAFFRIWFVDAPAMYVYIWPHTFQELYDLGWNTMPFRLAFAATALGVLALATRLFSLRALPLVFWSALGVFGVALQKKGFPYHLHPATFGVQLLALSVVIALLERAASSRRPFGNTGTLHAFVALLLGSALAFGLTSYDKQTLEQSSLVLYPWPEGAGTTAEKRGGDLLKSKYWLDGFATYDYYPREMRAAAAFVAAHTAPDERVQTYGMDPYVLFLAKRLSATPYIYAYDLDADAAWHGAQDFAPPGTELQAAAKISAMEAAHWQDLHERLAKRPAAAWILFDRAALTSDEDALEDIENHDPKAAALLRTNYWEAYAFGGVRVFLPRRPHR